MRRPSRSFKLSTESNRKMRGADKKSFEYSFECAQYAPAAAVIQHKSRFYKTGISKACSAAVLVRNRRLSETGCSDAPVN
ncbi:MAG: hypothetical protein UE970_03430 [Catenibacillus sp.]|nr:hypothetical protein [Catenibacillus sp.]